MQFVFEGDNTGNFTIQITCIDQPGIYSAELKYEMQLDQTYIKPLIKILDDILKQYPIVGEYND